MSAAVVLPGEFCWFELSTTDQDSARAFYRGLFGWDSADEDLGAQGVYTRFSIDGKEVAATSLLQPDQSANGVPPNWMIYVMVANADETASRVSAAGGTLINAPFDVDALGRMALIADPAGATFAIWEAKSHPGIGVTRVPHTVCWAELTTPDVTGATKFYGSVFDWKFFGKEDGTPVGPDDYTHIINNNHMIGGLPSASTRHPGIAPHWMIYFEVANCAAMVEKAYELGASVLLNTTAIGDTSAIAVLADPQGVVFGLHQG
jgi:hypothetical protein